MKLNIAFDIGGVLTKYRDLMQLMEFLRQVANVFILTDMKKKEAMDMLVRNGIEVQGSHVLCADYEHHGEDAKAVLVREHDIHILIDDHAPYCANTDCINLFVWPNPNLPYYADSWKTNGKEGNWGRARKERIA